MTGRSGIRIFRLSEGRPAADSAVMKEMKTVLQWILLHQAAVAEFEDAVAVGGEVFVVGDGDDGLTALPGNIAENVENDLRIFGIQVAGRFVAHDDRRGR